jgi:uncharacterized membrane protein YdjX (TVP38/TMEM64 family)
VLLVIAEPIVKPKFQIPFLVWMYLGVLLFLGALYLIFPDVRALVGQCYEILVSNDRKRIETFVAGFGWWGPVLIIGMMIAQTLLSAVPMILVLVVSVLAYGPIWGGLLGWCGAMIAAVIGYGIARVFGDTLQDKFVTPQIREVIARNVARYGAFAILALRLSPLVPSDGVSFVAGLLRMNFLAFILGTLGGVTPLVMVVAYFGSDFERLTSLVIGVTIISLTALIAWVAYDVLKKRKATS